MVSSGHRDVRGRRSIIIMAAAVVALLFLPLTASVNNNNNYCSLQSQSVFAQQQEEEQVAFLPYQNPIHGIFMQYPSNWIASTSGLTRLHKLDCFLLASSEFIRLISRQTHNICDNLWSERIASRIYRLGADEVESIRASRCEKFFRSYCRWLSRL